jgi:magnesium transporter
MLLLHDCASPAGRPADLAAGGLPRDVVWIDICNGEPGEIAFVEKVTGLHVPDLAELSEIESSSRLYTENGAYYLSMPIVSRSDGGDPMSTALGFVLTRERLITVRFAELKAFATFQERCGRIDAVHRSAVGAFTGILEAIVDRIADVLEAIGVELDAVSRRVFRDAPSGAAKGKRARNDADLRELLRQIGRAGDLASKIRDSLLGIGRIGPYVATIAKDWLPHEVQPHLETLRHDIASLNDYDGYLANKVQFLLDATLGLINIEQNVIIKVLTIVSVVGVPPTLIAGIYGMNFHDMPELAWTWGYPYGLGLIALTTVAPLIWFKIRGWF